MKFQQAQGFFSHLKNASPDHLCHTYLFIVSDDYERKQFIQYAQENFFPKTSDHQKYDGDISFKEIVEKISSPTLFSSMFCIVIDQVQKMKNLKEFSKWIAHQKNGYFLLGSSSCKQLEGLEKNIENHGIVFDLSSEKPWEKKARIEKQLLFRAKKQNVTLTEAALQSLIQKVGLNLAFLEQELLKLALFVGDKCKIDEGDIDKIVSSHTENSIWQMAEYAVWEKKRAVFSVDSTNDIHMFLTAVRHQFQIGIKLSNLMLQNVSALDLKRYFPRIWPKTLEKRKQQATQLTLDYFRRGLSLLFELEVMLRDSVHNLMAALDLFFVKLYLE